MQITINGSPKDFHHPATLAALIEQFCHDSKRVIVELNGSIVKNHEWDKKTLKDGDTLELVNFVGGG